MALKNPKVGGRVPVIFRTMLITEEEGAAHDETYIDGPRVFATVEMRNSLRNITNEQLQMSVSYKFTGIRQYEGFEPTKTMLINYKGRNLTIDSIVLDETKTPYYYTITASDNG